MRIDEKAVSVAEEIEGQYSKKLADFDHVTNLRKENAAADWLLVKVTYDPAVLIEEAKKIYWDKSKERATSGWLQELVAYQNMEHQFYSQLPYYHCEGSGPLKTLESNEEENTDTIAIRPKFFLDFLVEKQKNHPEIKAIDFLDSGEAVHAKVLDKWASQTARAKAQYKLTP